MGSLFGSHHILSSDLPDQRGDEGGAYKQVRSKLIQIINVSEVWSWHNKSFFFFNDIVYIDAVSDKPDKMLHHSG